MAKGTTLLLYYLGVALITGWFFTNAYITYAQNKEYSDELALNYSKFHGWSEPILRKRASFLSGVMPKPELMSAYK